MNQHKKSKNQLLVEVFMARCHAHPEGVKKQGIPLAPSMPSEAIRKLRAQLILEEALETITGLGMIVSAVDDEENRVNYLNRYNVEITPSCTPNMVEIVDGIADMEVVLLGTAAACGVAQQPIFDIVANNNLLKFAPGHKFSESGKLIKPPNHPSPAREIDAELGSQG